MNTPLTANSLMIMIGISVNILVFLGSLVGLWISVKLKIAKLETTQRLEIAALRNETDIKMKSVDSKIAGLTDFFGIRLREFVDGNKAEHDEIKTLVGKVFDKVDKIKDTQLEEHQRRQSCQDY